MKTHTKGERVNTALGAGAVAGFEHFDDEGMSLPPSDTDQGGRIVVTLDDPSAWIGQETRGDPYMFRSDIYTHPIGYTMRNEARGRRVTYRPDWSASQPWVSYKNGTAGRHFETENQAKDWLTAKD